MNIARINTTPKNPHEGMVAVSAAQLLAHAAFLGALAAPGDHEKKAAYIAALAATRAAEDRLVALL